MRLSWPRDEIDDRLYGIMRDIHQACLVHGRREDGTISSDNGTKLAGFIKVADAMLTQGVV